MTLINALELVKLLEPFKAEKNLAVEITRLQVTVLRNAADTIENGDNTELNFSERSIIDADKGQFSKINAIKAFRDRTKMGLKESKDIVEAYMQEKYGYAYYPTNRY